MSNDLHSKNKLNFQGLIHRIGLAHNELATQANRAVNVSLTLRNWLIGFYIREYQLKGSDRAEYGKKLLENMAESLKGLSNCNKRQLYRYQCFYDLYPQIVGTVSAQSKKLLPMSNENPKMGAVSPQSQQSIEKLINAVSYSHFELFVNIDNETKRAFYEAECLQGRWSVRELKRQINSLYYERSGLSVDKEKLSQLANQSAESKSPLFIRDPYIFEFLGLKAKEVMSESHLEDELLANIEDFLLELGHGFCFEAKQKSILIGDKHYFIG